MKFTLIKIQNKAILDIKNAKLFQIYTHIYREANKIWRWPARILLAQYLKNQDKKQGYNPHMFRPGTFFTFFNFWYFFEFLFLFRICNSDTMPFSRHEDDFLPAFSVLPVQENLGNLLSNNTKGGQNSFIAMPIHHLLVASPLENSNFEFKFHR